MHYKPAAAMAICTASTHHTPARQRTGDRAKHAGDLNGGPHSRGVMIGMRLSIASADRSSCHSTLSMLPAAGVP